MVLDKWLPLILVDVPDEAVVGRLEAPEDVEPEVGELGRRALLHALGLLRVALRV